MKIFNIILASITFIGGVFSFEDGDYLMAVIMFICSIGLLFTQEDLKMNKRKELTYKYFEYLYQLTDFVNKNKDIEVVNVLIDSYEIYDDKTMDARNFTLVYYIINKQEGL